MYPDTPHILATYVSSYSCGFDRMCRCAGAKFLSGKQRAENENNLLHLSQDWRLVQREVHRSVGVLGRQGIVESGTSW